MMEWEAFIPDPPPKPDEANSLKMEAASDIFRQDHGEIEMTKALCCSEAWHVWRIGCQSCRFVISHGMKSSMFP